MNHSASQQENKFVHHILQNSTSPWIILQDIKRTKTSSCMTLRDKQGRSSCRRTIIRMYHSTRQQETSSRQVYQECIARQQNTKLTPDCRARSLRCKHVYYSTTVCISIESSLSANKQKTSQLQVLALLPLQHLRLSLIHI